MQADQLRRAFTGFFADRKHAVVPSASLIPHDPTVLFTIAGMVPFKPYFVGDEPAPWPRATSVQKCFRTVDIDVVGSDTYHCTFFEMLGNFSFGDYFKDEAIPLAWELLTEVLGLAGDRLWITVHDDDDEAAQIWVDKVGLPAERLQRMGADNFWEPSPELPCGPCSEIYYDKGADHGAGGGPAKGDENRYVEIWNLVFMQYTRQPDATLADLPSKNIDTGAGLERILPILQGTDSVFTTDVLAPIVERAESLTGQRYGVDERADVALRVMADHARAMTVLVADGVLPSNEGRGYVLRRVVRRAVLAARRLGVETPVTGPLVASTVDVLASGYPSLVSDQERVAEVLAREEGGFDRTLKAGLSLLDEALAEVRMPGGASGADGSGAGASGADASGADASGADGGASAGTGTAAGERPVLSGDVAFRLHDTHGFPVELTVELADEAGVDVDLARFDEEMAAQRARARRSARAAAAAGEDTYRALAEAAGPSQFVGRDRGAYSMPAQVVGVLAGAGAGATAGTAKAGEAGGAGTAKAGEVGGAGTVEVFLDRTPFYPEGGGQVADVGTIVTETGRFRVVDTQSVAGGLIAHRGKLEGDMVVGQDALATIEADRREAVRRNHTATHLLHAALREVLGDHVRQQGSLVAPNRLHFDFSHHGAPSRDELVAVTELANADVITDEAVTTTVATRGEAEAMGALAFFGDKYGDRVRVVRAGSHSLELCGGTHVHALGAVGPITVVSEGSTGSGIRRIEAVTGPASLARAQEREALVADASELLKTEPAGLVEAISRLLDRQRAADRELQRLRDAQIQADAEALAAGVDDGVVVARRDGVSAEELRALAQAVQRHSGVDGVVLGGSPDGAKASLVAVTGGEPDATDLVRRLARHVQGGGGGSVEVAMAGGRAPEQIDAALAEARQTLGRP